MWRVIGTSLSVWVSPTPLVTVCDVLFVLISLGGWVTELGLWYQWGTQHNSTHGRHQTNQRWQYNVHITIRHNAGEQVSGKKHHDLNTGIEHEMSETSGRSGGEGRNPLGSNFLRFQSFKENWPKWLAPPQTPWRILDPPLRTSIITREDITESMIFIQFSVINKFRNLSQPGVYEMMHCNYLLPFLALAKFFKKLLEWFLLLQQQIVVQFVERHKLIMNPQTWFPRSPR